MGASAVPAASSLLPRVINRLAKVPDLPNTSTPGSMVRVTDCTSEPSAREPSALVSN